MKFLHLGIPTEKRIEGKTYSYVEKIKLYVTNPNEHELKIQYVCAEPDSPLPEIVRKARHLAIQVDNIEEAIKRFEYVAFGPVAVNENLNICFVVKEDVLFELTEILN